jgi:CBS domain-containing protein
LSKEEFKDALFDAVENLIEHKLSNPGRELIMSYFNDMDGDTSLERAVKAMEKYIHDDFPLKDKEAKN